MKKIIAKPILATIAGVSLFCALIIGVMLLTGTLQRWTADFRGETQAIEQTQGSGSYRIAAYEQFYNQCASVQSDEDRIANLEEEIENADPARVSQLNTSITAVKNSRAEKIREYNSDARQEATRGQFRDSDLPYELDVDEETSCYADE